MVPRLCRAAGLALLKEKMCRMWGALMATWGLPEYRKDSYLDTVELRQH